MSFVEQCQTFFNSEEGKDICWSKISEQSLFYPELVQFIQFLFQRWKETLK